MAFLPKVLSVMGPGLRQVFRILFIHLGLPSQNEGWGQWHLQRTSGWWLVILFVRVSTAFGQFQKP